MQSNHASFLRPFAGFVAVLATMLALGMPSLAQTKTISLFLGTTPDYGVVYVARDRGFLEAEGLKVDIRLFPSGTAATDGFRSGKIDFVASADLPGMRLCQVMDAKVVASLGYDDYSTVMMTKSNIRTGDDLRGKTISTRIGSAAELFVQYVRDKYKLSNDAFKLVNMEPADMVAALDNGNIDGFLWTSPFEEKSMEISGNRVRLFLRGHDVGFTNEVTLTARGDLVANDPELVKKFVRALVKGGDYAMAHPDETVDIVAAALKLDHKAAEVTKKMSFVISFDQRVYDRYSASANFMVEKKMTETPVDLSTCFWPDAVAAAAPSRVYKR